MKYLILFLIGALIVPAGDVVHVLTQTTEYSSDQLQHTLFGVIPWWVPFLFGFAGLSAGLQTEFLRKKDPRKRAATVPEFAGAMIAFLGMYFLSGLLPKGWLADGILAVCGVLLFLFVAERSFTGVLQALMIAIGGTAFEIMLVHFGVFRYVEPHNELFGVAPWLPWLYVAVGVAVDSFSKWWNDRSIKS